MYEEGHSGFAFKSIIVKLLLIVIIVFLVIWLFPTKNYVKNIISQKLGTGVDQVFNTNIETMKNAAISYYNGGRLPSKTGDSRTLTLKEMLDKNLLISFSDSNGKKCDLEKSYVKVTKNDEDYSLKVNLVCNDKSAYINSYITGVSCTDAVCSKKKITENNDETKDNKESEKKDDEPTDAKQDVNVNNTAVSEQCQYVKKLNGYYKYGAWSNWSLEPVQANNTREVQTKQEKIQTGTILVQDGTVKHTQNPKKVTISKYGKTSIKYVCPSDFDNGGVYNNYVTCVKTMPNYVNKPTYRNATYYRYRTKTYINGGNDYKWSNCNDGNLKASGYSLTGNKK